MWFLQNYYTEGDNIMSFQETLLEYMQVNSLRVTDIFIQTGIPTSMISSYVKYGIVPDLKTLIKFSDLMQASLEYLLGRTDSKEYTKEENPVPFGQRLSFLIKNSGKSNRKIARELQINDSLLSKWIRKTIPKTEYLIKLADYFEVTVDYLVGREK